MESHRAARWSWVISASEVKSAFSFGQELPKFQELIFEDFDNFILVENTYEEVVLQSVMKDIMQGERAARVWVGGQDAGSVLHHAGKGPMQAWLTPPQLASLENPKGCSVSAAATGSRH